MGVETALAIGSLAVGAAGVRQQRRDAKRQARALEGRGTEDEPSVEQEVTQERKKEDERRRGLQRAALASQPTMFDLLRGPDV